MPLNNSYDEQAVVQAIASALETFYGTLIEKIDGLNVVNGGNRQRVFFLFRLDILENFQLFH